MKKIMSIIAISVFVMISFVSCVNSIETNTTTEKKSALDRIVETNTLRIGTSGEQFPFSFKDDKGELDGLDIRIAKAMANRMDVKAEFVQIKFDELIPALQDGKVDIVLSGVTSTLKRNVDVAFSQPYFKTGKAILSKNKKLVNNFDSLLKVEGVRIAVFDKSTSEDYLKETYPNAELFKINTFEQITNLLLNDKIDAFIGDYEICESISYTNLTVSLYLSKIGGDPEYISVAIAKDDFQFYNLTQNFIRMVNDHDVGIVVDELWLEFLNK